MFFGNTAKIIEAIATVKADTKNHKEDIREMKEAFDKHIDKEDKQQIEYNTKIDKIHCKLQGFECPRDEKILKLERRIHDNTKQDQKRRVADLEAKAVEITDRADKDEKVAAEIASLKTSRKYQWLTSSGIYIILGVILKKIFTS